MKKMITLLAIIMVAGMTQAASVSWNVAGNTFAKSPDDLSGNARAKFYSVLVFSAADQASVLAQLALGNVAGVGGVSSFAKGVRITTAAGGTFGTLTDVTLNATYPIFAIAFDTWGAAAASPLATANHYNMSSTLTANTYSPPNSGDKTGFWAATTVVGTSTAWAGGVGTGAWTSVVPEPTSMALLALGVAAVGLRRKFRK
jgi:hypothetical protein